MRADLAPGMTVGERGVQVDVASRNGEYAVLGHRVPSIENEVQEDLVQLRGIHEDMCGAGGEIQA